jgi:hypothetical protein
MRYLWLHGVLSCAMIVGTSELRGAEVQQAIYPKDSIRWFQRASDQLNIRLPGSASFHMKVNFHALAGKELLGLREKPQIVSGDGTYEETWIAPHKWRREVRFAQFEATEVESEEGRKIQSSLDYEPSRVLMLLNSILEPIPRNFLSREYKHEGASGWRVDHASVGRMDLIRVSASFGTGAWESHDTYYFSSAGLLLMRNEIGLVTQWQNDVMFAGKAVPKLITIGAGTERKLLTAEVSIEAVDRVESQLFRLPGSGAERGMTLLPLQMFEVRSDVGFAAQWMSRDGSLLHAFSIWSVVDRHGQNREVEIIQEGTGGDVGPFIELLKKHKSSPPEIDGSPCELAVGWALV